jgi:hypothetical protein
MFDKTFVSHNSSPREITVNENRAPTDDSIRLSEEYREKLRQEFVNAYVFDGANEMNGIVVQFYNSCTHLANEIYISFDFNGQHFDCKETLKMVDVHAFNRVEAYHRMFKQIMDRIGLELAGKFVMAVDKH